MKFFKTFFGFTLGFILSLFILELFLQLEEVNTVRITRLDDTLGLMLKPNQKFLYFNEGFSMGKTNQYGYYGPGYAREKENKAKRIALIGNSYVGGVQVFERNHFRNKLEELLNEKEISNKYQVLNFGRNGLNLNDMYCYYQIFAKQFNPSIKLVFISPGDLINKGATDSRPYAFLENDSIKIGYSFKESKRFKWRKSTSFFRGKSIILGYVLRAIELVKTDNYKPVLYGKFSPSVVRKEEVFKKRDSLSKRIKNIILELRNEDFIFVAHSEVSTSNYDYLLDEFTEFSKENNVKVIHLSPLFKKLRSEKVNYNYWPIANRKGHFNERGHMEIAKFLNEYIKKIK